jgi:limonene-1,2-epoxide hydrolase
MTTPTETVMAFLAMCEKPGGFADAVRAFFTPTTRYINVGMTDSTGIDEGIAVVQSFETAMGATSLKVDMLALAEAGGTVLTERIDHLLGADGQPAMSLAVMGIFEVADGKITAWRDYFDTAGTAGGKPSMAHR